MEIVFLILGVLIFWSFLVGVLSPRSTDRFSKSYWDYMDRFEAREWAYKMEMYEADCARLRKRLRHKIGDGKEPGAPGTPIGKSVEWYETDYPALDTGELIE
jgi:hypothetical protein